MSPPFELALKTFGGSGYDVACAQSEGPILYELKSRIPKWSTAIFDPPFKDQLYFVHQGVKRKTRDAILEYRQKGPYSPSLIESASAITKQAMNSKSLLEFNQVLCQYETLVAENLSFIPIKERCFSDFWGEVKSLGAWGGDLFLVTSNQSEKKTREYFSSRGFSTFLSYQDLIFEGEKNLVH